jgi:hypothetical protein
MRFEAQLTHVSGYLRSGKLVGELTEAEYIEWKQLSPKEQQQFLWDLGRVEVTDYRVEDAGDYYNIQWVSDEILQQN